ncbi:hypothetical protein [Catenuloplanes indicus]|uniref:Uncharacterized protein n=1 Tax=Catenuloplanes indicus TaxID=137267 RepID=A0AAE3W8J7_9ACTN|nr:hypothetical protein [Catenuloplanes indicus]MDQ0371603.1 hypothetical protein [Catenuloplanes indicus]MDQ0371616.1 hypothetical protein [Catenuloplanes indicus]
MSDARFQVIAECAYAKIADAAGVSWRLFEKGALIPANTPNLDHLLRNHYVAKVGEKATGGLNADGFPSGAEDVEVPEGITTTPSGGQSVGANPNGPASDAEKAAAEVAERRAAARAKLPADGAAPDGRAGKDVHVEYLVGKGYDYDELVKQDKADLVEMGKQQS